MSQSIMNEIFKLVCFDGVQQKKWSQCKDLDSQLQFIRDAIPQKINEATKNYDYEALEKQVQKYEHEIRKHIRMEQQIKLYAESLQQKLEEQEGINDCLSNTKQLVNVIIPNFQSLKKENQQLIEQVKRLQSENYMLKTKLMDVNERINSHQTSPIYDKTKNQDSYHIKNSQRYQTIDFVAPKQKLNQKNVEDYSKQYAEVKTQISNTIDSSILKMLQNRRDSLKLNDTYKSSRDSSTIEKNDSNKIKSCINQQRAASQQQKTQHKQMMDQSVQQVKTTTENVKFDLKNQSDNLRAFLNTQSFLCNKKSKTNSRPENRYNKSHSEHQNANTNQQEIQKSNKIQKEYLQFSQNYQKYLDNQL
ncbi:unnamed protein product (macronuclear) [Paramecium tetraurelia]|uniref:Uncharacterized protein n=1 Tax=Paramecium tetraurelia TaxID=5888 RepID=A0CR92_PARTE|nr:uncharacterized protein GSPATT00009624001 [Paramecium tetraurelia]CAK73309.1 unnamed protein product [Paramecium tetraurelia]|eukprot:XP_001440706.1 hypothetical protein (macronuclear) [Paramecium tetraurelia strain d4-2]